MKVKVNKKYLNLLDSALLPSTVRIDVSVFLNVKPINSQYFERKRSFFKIYYYLKELGVSPVFSKVYSRWVERYRNKKYFSVGIGKVLQVGLEVHSIKEADFVFFIANNHPNFPERVVVDCRQVFPVDSENFNIISSGVRVHLKNTSMVDLSNFSKCGRDFLFSGFIVPEDCFKKIYELYLKIFENSNFEVIEKKPIEKSSEISEIFYGRGNKIHKKSAVLFGFGNYAKTVILPNLNSGVAVQKIHEIDPLQLLPMKKNLSFDTSPFPRENDSHDVFFIAGYHHTHAQIAIEGLRKNKDVVVEKPLVTTVTDLEKLLEVMKSTTGSFYACFQKRYHRFNQFVHIDMELKKGDPISYHAIVYEETLPALHWYRWPNSRSAIVSNGCHWVDHFCFLNEFSPVVSYSARKMGSSELFVLVELENKAIFSLVLSHLGSARIGMQEYVELRAANTTIKIMNSGLYIAENNSRILRKCKENKYNAYRNMYKEISTDIVSGKKKYAESLEKLERVSSVILSLDEEVMRSV